MLKAGESVFVADDNDQEIVVNIGDFICASVDDKFYSLIRGELEIYCYNSGKMVVPSSQQVVFHTDRILRKIMLYPEPENLAHPSHFITIDPVRKTLSISHANVIVPFYPLCGDVVVVSCADGNDYIANITSVLRLDDMCEKAMDIVPCIQLHGIASRALQRVTGREMCGSNNLHSGKQVTVTR